MAARGTRQQYPVGTIALIAISVALTLYIELGANEEALRPLLISDPAAGFLGSIAQGEVWRLVTPMFIHFGILHIAFNMMWLWDLGRAIEGRQGPRFLALFVFTAGIAANLAQYLITGSPYFGGMSGVVYGLLGYLWMRGPSLGIHLHQSTVIMMLVWYVLCWTGLVGPIANWAHTGGLLIGVAWGYLGRNARA